MPLAVCSQGAASTVAGAAKPRPNIILILADDLGFSDIGIYGSEIRTPNIDQLASQGLMLSNYHTGPQCSITRSMLLTGNDNHRVGYGSSRGGGRRVPELVGQPGYEFQLNDQAVLFSRHLQQAGYRTYMAGKWDVGQSHEDLPPQRGFARSFVLMDGGASHFGDRQKNLAHLQAPVYMENGKVVARLAPDFYSSKFYTTKIIDYIEQDRNQADPFFAFVSFTAPHWPLQVPVDWLARYRGHYDRGWMPTYKDRLKKLNDLGVFEVELTEKWAADLDGRWHSLIAEQKLREIRVMEVYAAMVGYMDVQVGRLVNYLKQTGQYDNTVIVFVSDNGPEGNDVAAIGPKTRGWLGENFDNSIENIGKQGSYAYLKEGWATVSAAPFKLYKTYIAEGGMRVPAIIKMPGANQARRSADYVDVRDLAPTILALAGADAIAQQQPMYGNDLSGLLASELAAPGADNGWESFGNRAYFKGKWKAELIWPQQGNGQWKLYDLSTDPQTINDRAAEHPQLLRSLIQRWQDYAEKNGVYKVESDFGYGRWPTAGE